MRIYVNGEIQDKKAAAIDPGDRGFLLGDGVFETLLAAGGTARHLHDHLTRLREAAGIVGVGVPADIADAGAIIERLLAANGLEKAAVRLTLTRGPGPRGLAPAEGQPPTVVITAAPLAEDRHKPVAAAIARTTARNECSPLARIKSLNYLDNILALREVRGRGAEEALLLNTQGRLSCASAANVFVVIDGELITPPISEGVLPGLVRGRLIRALGAKERKVTPDDLLTVRASEVFLTNSLSLRSVLSVDGRAVGTGNPGPVAENARRIAFDP